MMPLRGTELPAQREPGCRGGAGGLSNDGILGSHGGQKMPNLAWFYPL